MLPSSPLAKVFTPDHRVTLNANPWIPGEELELYGLVKIMDKPTDPDFLGNYLLSAFTIDQKEVRTMVKGVVTLEEMDVAPYLHKSRTMLPVRFVGQSLGMDVAYDESTQDIVLKDSHRTITLNLNSDMVTTSLSPDPYKLDSQPVLVEGRTMLPVGQVADILGFSRTDLNHPGGYLGWDDQNQRVTLMIPAELKADNEGCDHHEDVSCAVPGLGLCRLLPDDPLTRPCPSRPNLRFHLGGIGKNFDRCGEGRKGCSHQPH